MCCLLSPFARSRNGELEIAVLDVRLTFSHRKA